MTGEASGEAGAMSQAVLEAAVPRGAVGEGAGRACRELGRAGSGAGHAPAAAPGEAASGAGRAEPGLATALPSQLVFPSKQGKAAGEEGSYA